MQLIANGTQYGTSPPVPQAPVGTPGYINNQTPGAGVTPTVVDPDANNAIIAELVNLVTGTGIALASGTFTQAIQAVRRLGAGNVSVQTATATLTADSVGLALVNAGAGAMTLTLPAAAALGGYPLRLRFTRTDNSANAVTIQRAGADTFGPGGAAPTSFTLGVGQTIEIASDGVSAWYCVHDSFSGQRRAVITSGASNWTVPWGVTSVIAKVWGDGGGGAGSASGQGGGGGGGGAYCESQILVQPGETIAYSIGAGGAGGTAGANGSPGAGTTFSTLTAGGGGAGSASSPYNGGAGGVASGGQVNMDGSRASGGGPYSVPTGGSSPQGGDGGGASNGGGSAGATPGGGGAGYGPGSVGAGMAGAPGLIEIVY